MKYISKSDVIYMVGDINRRYMNNNVNRRMFCDFYRKDESKHLVEISVVAENVRILNRNFSKTIDCWNYLIGVKDWLDVL